MSNDTALRRPLKQSRRTLIATAVLVCLCLGAYLLTSRDSSRIRVVSDLGGSLNWEYAGPNWPWLEQGIVRYTGGRGTPLFGRLAMVRLDDTPADDATLERLGDLRSVTRVVVAPLVTDAGVTQLVVPIGGGSTWMARATDRALKRVATFQKLRVVLLARAPISDYGLEYLGRMESLSSLDVYGTAIGDDGLKYLRSCTGMHGLHLQRTQVTDGGLVHLSKMTDLRVLYLGDTAVTDAGLQRLSDLRLRKLDTLDVSGTSVSDAGLPHLYRLANLRTVDLRHSQVTSEGVELLREQLPKATVKWPD
jgi:hypothetical protein